MPSHALAAAMTQLPILARRVSNVIGQRDGPSYSFCLAKAHLPSMPLALPVFSQSVSKILHHQQYQNAFDSIRTRTRPGRVKKVPQNRRGPVLQQFLTPTKSVIHSTQPLLDFCLPFFASTPNLHTATTPASRHLTSRQQQPTCLRTRERVVRTGEGERTRTSKHFFFVMVLPARRRRPARSITPPRIAARYQATMAMRAHTSSSSTEAHTTVIASSCG